MTKKAALLLLGTCGRAVLGLYLLLTTTRAVPLSAPARRTAYRPRLPLDTSGVTAVAARLKPWRDPPRWRTSATPLRTSAIATSR